MLALQVGLASNGLSTSPVGPFTPRATSFAGAIRLILNTWPTAAFNRYRIVSFGLMTPMREAVVWPGSIVIRIAAVVVDVAVAPDTLISSHHGLLACAPMPKSVPLEFLKIHWPRYEPGLEGAVRFTEMSTVWPGATSLGNGTAETLPICSPLKNTS